MRRRPSVGPRSHAWSLRRGVRRGSRVGAGLSALLLVVSALSVNAITAGITVPEGAQAPAIGPPSFAGNDEFDVSRRAPIPRAAFEKVNPSCPPPVSISKASIDASGGDEVDVTIGGVVFRQHRFTSGGTFIVSDASQGARVEVLIVGGGGGGGKRHGGGGGAGGLVLAPVRVSAGDSFAVTVGQGGEGGGKGSTPTAALNGGESTFGLLTALGGGRGASFNSSSAGGNAPSLGGSGGGAQRQFGNEKGADALQPEVVNRCAIMNDGHPGGGVNSDQWPGGGGGGAGGPGGTVGDATGQVGGPGLDLSDRFGVDVGDDGWFAGGGGGAPKESGSSSGGKGGGGTGQGDSAAGWPGQNGTGGGGGASRSSIASAEVTGGRGGDGIVIVRYPLVPGPVREAIVAEARESALLRWRVPATNAPATDSAYLIEYRPTTGGDWQQATDPDIEGSGAGSDRVVTASFGVSLDQAHEFRITPLNGVAEGDPVAISAVAKGGDAVEFIGDDVLHAFTSVGTANFDLVKSRPLRYLVVGGGGGGGSRHGGGGGAGGVLTNALDPQGLGAEAQSYPIVVGAGGPGALSGGDSIASKGGNPSSAFEVTALGGGAGSSRNVVPLPNQQNGGSGGGARGNTGLAGGTGADGQGFAGGAGGGATNSGRMMGGGGGGAAGQGEAGGDGTGDGGPGMDFSATFGITFGDQGRFAGGGGGGGDDAGSQSQGGDGGGGRGGLKSTLGSPGQNGTGGGGGAGGHNGGNNRSGHDGGSGIVLVRYSFLDSGVQSGVFAEAATSAVLRFEEPELGTETITGYLIERSTDGVAWTTVNAAPTASGPTRTLSLTGLPSASARRFRVTALHGARAGSITELDVVGRGGTSVTLVDGEVVHRYETTVTQDFRLAQSRVLEVLVVAGGGGGGGTYWAGGGGGGGILHAPALQSEPATTTVIVGAGGAGATSHASGANGQNSRFGAATALGGGGGGGYGWGNANYNARGSGGGSGGGSGENNADAPGGAALNQSPPPGWSAYGNAGGDAPGGGVQAGSGGGGAGARGGNSSRPNAADMRRIAGNGGGGRQFVITGTAAHFGGGGGGGTRSDDGPNTQGLGGVGGGGNGGFPPAAAVQSGATNTGGGGGGGHDGNGGAGGSGIVIVRYQLAP